MKRRLINTKPKNRTKENDRHMGKQQQQQYPILDEQKTFNFPMACRQQQLVLRYFRLVHSVA